MRISILDGPDLLVRDGAPVSAIVAFCGANGLALPDRPYCGPVTLDPDHPAGVEPLVEGAVLGSRRTSDVRADPGPHLACVAGPDTGAIAPLSRSTRIGRDAACDLRLSDSTVSHVHATVTLGRGIRIHDEGSLNGTVALGSGRASRRGRTVPDGAVLIIGASMVEVRAGHGVEVRAGRGVEVPRNSPTRASVSRAGMAAGSVGALLAIGGGRWGLAIAALAYPIAATVQSLRRRRTLVVATRRFDPCGVIEGHRIPSGHLAIVGNPGQTQAFARGVALGRGAPAPGSATWEQWMEWLPRADPADTVTTVPSGTAAPSWTRTTALVHEGAVTWSDTPEQPSRAATLTVARALEAARRIAARGSATSSGVVRYADLPTARRRDAHGARCLAIPIGVGEQGVITLDLDAHGPHVLVAGTTGSGKSVALELVVSALALAHPPEDLTLALMDFKGGAGLRECLALPHVRAVLTDLEPHLARRALAALAREIENRKRALAAANIGSFQEWETRGDAPPRLLVVVDEFQEITARYREFVPDLTRLAAQGRSLGMHLILATQRPAGAVSPDVRANISTTIALRTSSGSESRDLIGNPQAASLDPQQPGSALIAHSGTVKPVRIALPTWCATPAVRRHEDVAPPTPPLAQAAARAHARSPAVPPLWREPLPLTWTPPSTSGGMLVGLGDWPETTRQAPLTWDLRSPLGIVGPPNSGRSGALASLLRQAPQVGHVPVWLPRDAREAARTITLAAARPDVLLAIDDAATILPALASHEPQALEALTNLCVGGRAIAIVLPPTWAHHRLAGTLGIAAILTGLPETDEVAWGIPHHLRGATRRPARAIVRSTDGWCETQLGWASDPGPAPLVATLPLRVTPRDVPAEAPDCVGIGGDDAAFIRIAAGDVAIVGPPGAERDEVAARITLARESVGRGAPSVHDYSHTLAATAADGTIVVVRPTARSVRECTRTFEVGLVDLDPPPLRVVVASGGVTRTVQLAGVSSEGV